MSEQSFFYEGIAQYSYGKSSNPFAEENVNNEDFQSGYLVGSNLENKCGGVVWQMMWRIYQDGSKEQWQDFRRGFWAGQFTTLNAEKVAPDTAE